MDDVDNALGVAETGKAEKLIGLYPMAAQVLADEVRRLRYQVAEWEKLGDPVILHANLLRGIPTRLDRDTFLHLAGSEMNMTKKTNVVGAICPGRHMTKDGREVYIACRCSIDGHGAKNAYPWLVEDGKGGCWSVDDEGRHMKNGATIFDIVSRAGPNI